jgi:hypothetical protein
MRNAMHAFRHLKSTREAYSPAPDIGISGSIDASESRYADSKPSPEENSISAWATRVEAENCVLSTAQITAVSPWLVKRCEGRKRPKAADRSVHK